MKDVRDISILEGATIRDAMETLDRRALQIALVVNADGRLLGTVTDGDIRRALLAGATLASPVLPHAHQGFTSVSPMTGRADVLDLMRSRRIEQVPVVDEAGRVVGVHTLHALLGIEKRTNWAVIMAGGRGERLRPLTDVTPKPMIRVAGKPILERLVLHLVGYGIREIYLSVNYLGDAIRKHFGDGATFGCNIKYLQEDEPLGTGGALSLLPAKPTETLLVMNGDLLTQADIGAMLEAHARGRCKITVGVREYSFTIPYGCVEVEGDRVLRLEEKPVLGRLINTGIYALEPDVIGRVPQNQHFLITSLIEQAIAIGDHVSSFRISDDWIDVGQKEQLRQAREGS